MKLFGALQPHRADSNRWNDSFGGNKIINNYNTNSNSFSTNSNRTSEIITTTSSNQINTKPNRIDASPDRKEGERSQACGRDEKGSETISARDNSFDMIRSAPEMSGVNMRRIQQSLSLLLSPLQSSNLLPLSRGQQRFRCSLSRYFLVTFLLLCVFTNCALCDEVANGSSVGPEFTTLSLISLPTIPPFDNATRGNKKFGDRCEDTQECGFPGSLCDPRKNTCQCIEDLPVTNHLDKCGKEAAINESCFFNEQCEAFHFQTECRDNRCVCRFEMSPVVNKDGNVECKGKQMKHDEVERYVDPAMIGVLVGMALMFIIICVVLRLFSRARWRENRTIFNTPNPRLMNVSLLRDNKLMHGQERRGSRMSMRAPSRQPSMASLRPHSPNPSLGKAGSRPGSRGSSNASAISTRSALAAASETKPTTNSNCADSNSTLVITNIIENPAAESVTIEISEPKTGWK